MEETANVYSELYSYLNIVDKELIERIPNNVYEKIYNEKNNEYTPIYNIEDFQDINKMQKQTRIYIFYLHWKYWCDSDEEKKELEKILEDNEKKWIEKCMPFKKEEKSQLIKENEKALIVVEKKWYSKLLDWIKVKIFKK